MIRRVVMTVLCGVLVALGLSATATPATAKTCSNVEVIFARGTVEPAPPLGFTGISFTEALRSQLRGRSLAVNAVNYPASANFGNRIAFATTVVNGIRDTQNRIKFTARTCPRTRIVLGGYSQGAVVAGYAVAPSTQLPPSYARYAGTIPGALPAEVARHVAAVVLFAVPSARFLRDAGAPVLTVGPLYGRKTIRYCSPGDNICNGAPLAGPGAVHVLYSVNGSTLDAARRVVARL